MHCKDPGCVSAFVALGLPLDLGKYCNVWRPIFLWQGNSVLFEVGICVVCYLAVLYLEFLPIVVERLKEGTDFPGPFKLLGRIARTRMVAAMVDLADKVLGKVMLAFIIMGVVLSCLHQSSLGALMLIAPTKMHPLWYTPISPLLFLSSAIQPYPVKGP